VNRCAEGPLDGTWTDNKIGDTRFVEGFCGPMYDGESNGVPIIRYEEQATNDFLSI
jgi:hypothetical protein